MTRHWHTHFYYLIFLLLNYLVGEHFVLHLIVNGFQVNVCLYRFTAEIELKMCAFDCLEEWIKKRKVEKVTTKQIETRVKRQVVLQDGQVIDDSGPQVSTNTTEDTQTKREEHTEVSPNPKPQSLSKAPVSFSYSTEVVF